VGEKSYKRIVGKREWKIPFERLDADENIMKINHREMGCILNLFGLLSGLVNTVMILQVPKEKEYLLTS
jgi:hypothetical protein